MNHDEELSASVTQQSHKLFPSKPKIAKRASNTCSKVASKKLKLAHSIQLRDSLDPSVPETFADSDKRVHEFQSIKNSSPGQSKLVILRKILWFKIIFMFNSNHFG